MITVFLDTDKFSLYITDSNLEGYIRILPLKDLILIMGEEGLELTILNKESKFLYTFIEGDVTVEGVSLLGDIMGYHVALGNESNIRQVIEQNSLTYIGYEYLYSYDGNLYLYYGENFNILPTLIPVSPTLTAGDWMDITDGVISVASSTTNLPKELNTADTHGGLTKSTTRRFGEAAIDTQTFTIVDDGTTFTTDSAEYRFGATGSLFTVNDWVDGAITTVNEVEITTTNIRASAYPNTRNDGEPSCLLFVDADGVLQVYNGGATIDITLTDNSVMHFVKGVLVEFQP